MTAKLELYRVFREVAETGNISAAAQTLYISQSAVSQSVKQLEGVFGAMGGGEYGVLGQAGMSGGARRAAALGDGFEYRGGFEHQHRVLLVEGS